MKRFVAMLALAVGGGASAQEVYVGSDNTVASFDASTQAPLGSVVTPGSGGLSLATGIAQGPDGNLYVSSADDDTILLFDGRNGAFLAVFADENDRLRGPAGLAFGTNGNLYVANRLRNEVIEFTLSGGIAGVFGRTTSVPLLTPEDVGFGADGFLYIADANNNRIFRVDPVTRLGSEFIGAASGLNYPHAIAFDSVGNIYVSSHLANEVLRFSAAGVFLGVFANVTAPTGLAFDGTGALNVVSFGTGRVERFDAAGTALAPLAVGPDASFVHLVDRPVFTDLSRSLTSVFGGCQTSTVRATIDRPAPAGGFLLRVTSSSPAVIVPASVSIPQGSTSVDFIANTLSVASSTTGEIRATGFGVSRSTFLTVNPVGLATGTAALTLTPTTVAGGAAATGIVQLFCPSQVGDVVVTLSSAAPSIASVPATLTIPNGQLSGNFTVTTVAPASSTTVSISARLDRIASRNLTVTQSVTLSAVNLASTSFTGGSSTTGTVTLTAPAPAGGLSISLSSSISQATVPATVFVTEGATTSATFTVSSTAVATNTNGSIAARFGASTASRAFVLRPIPVQSVTLAPTSVTSNQTSTGTVTLEFPAAPGDVVVNLTSQSPSIANPTTTSITIPQGQQTGTFTVRAGAVTSRQTARIVASTQGSTTTKYAILTVNP